MGDDQDRGIAPGRRRCGGSYMLGPQAQAEGSKRGATREGLAAASFDPGSRVPGGPDQNTIPPESRGVKSAPRNTLLRPLVQSYPAPRPPEPDGDPHPPLRPGGCDAQDARRRLPLVPRDRRNPGVHPGLLCPDRGGFGRLRPPGGEGLPDDLVRGRDALRQARVSAGASEGAHLRNLRRSL